MLHSSSCICTICNCSPQLQSLTGELESHLSTEVTSLQSPLRPYLENLSTRHSEMTTLFRLVLDDGASLVEMFKPTGESAGDSGRSARISAQISNLQTHCQRVEQLWSDAWGREGGAGAGKMTTSGRKTTGGGRTSNQPTKRESVTGRASGQVKTDEPSGTRGRSQSKTSLPSQASVAKPRQTSQANANKVKPGPTTKSGQTSSAKASATTSQTSTAKAGATSSQTSTATSQVGKTHQTNTSVTVSRGSGDVGKNKPTGRVGKAAQRLSSPTYTQPPPPPPPTSTPTTSAARSGGTSSKSSEPRKRDSFKARDKGASPTAVGPGNSSAKRLSDTYGDLEAEAYKVSQQTCVQHFFTEPECFFIVVRAVFLVVCC